MRRRIRVRNRSRGALWWRVLLVVPLWLVVAAPQVIAVAVYRTYQHHAADLPDVPDLARFARTAPRTTRIVAADGTILAEIPFTVGLEAGHRDWIARADLPASLVSAILAAEDLRFYEHDGVDLRAVARAAWANYKAGRTVEGASTITQQVARNLLPEEIGRERTARRKLREMILARRLERIWEKDQIFEAYANLVFLGSGAYGFGAAARAYFDRPLDELDVAEHAMLAGLIQAPSRRDPWHDPDAARARRDEILARMHRAGMLSDAELAAAVASPLALKRPPTRYGTLAPYMTELARRGAAERDAQAWARGGLVVETTVWPVDTLRADLEAVRGAAKIARRQKSPAPQVGAFVVDHTTGYVVAVVGGLDWEASQFDRATQACRQPGSAFKPIVYAAAVERDAITPGTALRDAPVTEYDEDRNVFWKPSSAGHEFRGVALAVDALAASLNAPAVDVLDRVGTRAVVEHARRLGLTTPLDEVRPLVLGSSCAIPAELATAYAVFAAGGARVGPTVITRIRAGDRTVVDLASPWDGALHPARRLDLVATRGAARVEQVVDPETAFLVTSMLAEVTRAGTARDARAVGRPVAGKTGTTNDNTDAWFVGFSGRLTAAVWVGHDDPSTPLGPREDGRHAALPIWIALVKTLEAGRTPLPVPGSPPDGVVQARIDRETGLLAAPGAGGATDVWFRLGTAPTETAARTHGVSTDLDRQSRGF